VELSFARAALGCPGGFIRAGREDRLDRRAVNGAGGITVALINFDAFAKTLTMAKQKFRPARLGVFSGAKAYI